MVRPLPLAAAVIVGAAAFADVAPPAPTPKLARRAVAGSGDEEALSAVWGSGRRLFAVGSNGKVLRSIDGGERWADQASGTTDWLLGVWGPAAGRGEEVFAVGWDGTV